ncbi:MAG: metal ABC transporter substrate-binding protein [Bacteroidota bacterium]
MKKGLLLFLLTCLSLALMGQPKLKVVTSLSDLAEFTRVIGGDRVEVDNLVRGSQNPHYIDVKPSYMMKLKSAQAFVIIGMQLELWAPQIIDGSRNANLLVIDCSKYVHKMEVPGTKLDASAGDVHPFGNPHYWLDPENIRFVLQGICEGLTKLSPHDQEYFQSNMDSYLERLAQKIGQWKTIMAPLRGKKLVTYHSSFSYFAERFGLHIVGYVEPKPGIPPTPSHSTELINLMRQAGVKVIGLEQYYEDNTPRQIAETTGATVVRLSTSVGGLEGTDDYIRLMDHNVRLLATALQ